MLVEAAVSVWRREEIFRIVGWGGAAGVGNIPSIPRPASGQTLLTPARLSLVRISHSRPLIGQELPVLPSLDGHNS